MSKDKKPTHSAYCGKCKGYRGIRFMMKVEGSREQVRCLSCESVFWIGGGYGL